MAANVPRKTLFKLTSALFRTPSEHPGGILGASDSLALTTTASSFYYIPSVRALDLRSQNQKYFFLPPSIHALKLTTKFSYNGGYFSTVDDDGIIYLIWTMPKSKIIQLGNIPH